MKKVIIGIGAVAGGLVVLLIGAVLLIPQIIDVEKYKPQIEAKISEITGRSFSLGSDFDVSVFPWVGVSFSNLELGNPEGFHGTEFVKVNSFEARVKVMPLLSKKLEIKKFVLDGPELHLIKKSDGSGNWSMGTGADNQTDITATPENKQTETKKSDGFVLSSLEVGEFAVTNGKILFEDTQQGTKKVIDGITLKLNDVTLERPIALFFEAQLDGKPIIMEGNIGPIGKDPGAGTIGMALAIKAFNEVALTLDGKIVEPASKQQFLVNLKVDPFSPKKLFNVFGMELPVETADSSTLSKVAVDIHLSGTPMAVELSKSLIHIDDTTITLQASIKEFDKPDTAFSVDIDSINIDRYLPSKKKNGGQEVENPGSGQPSAVEPNGVENKQPAAIDYGPLRRIVVDGSVTIGQLVASGAKVENVQLKITGKEGVFTLDPFTLDLYSGKIGILGNFNFQDIKPLGEVDFNAQSIQVGPLLQDAANKDILEGTMTAQAAITFSGDNGDDIKKDLNGTGKLRFNDGAIVGIDIAELGRSLASGVDYQKPKEKPRTDFAELHIPFVIVDGLFKTEKSNLRSPLLRLSASGTADLVSEKLDMKVQPKVVGTLKGQGDAESRSGLSLPLLVEGTFAKPEISADFSSLASEETVKQVIENPEAAKEKVKELEETGKGLLKSFGFGD